MNSKKRIFMTGATGNMGRAALSFFVERLDRFELRLLVLPTERERALIRPHLGRAGIEVVWGDLTRPDDVLKGVEGADVVLHVGGLVSPVADRDPALTKRVNVGAATNIVWAIKQRPEATRPRLVYIGSVAQTGNRPPPVHWGRTGDPIKVSAYDHYAVTKVEAEAIIAESGLHHWVSLRQTGIAHTDMWQLFDPIMFHAPLNGVFEWVTARDSGRLLANLCEDGVPESLWRNFYNIGGGEPCRVTQHEFLSKCFKVMGLRDWQRVVEPNWFATQNFHGQWFVDSDRLEALVPFRSESFDDFISEMARTVPFYVRAAGALTPSIVRHRLRALAKAPNGPLGWVERDDEAHIAASFGSRQAWQAIAGWAHFTLETPSKAPTLLSHGYDEATPKSAWHLAMLREAAAFRGVECLSQRYVEGDPFALLEWRCLRGHVFSMSPNLMLAGGHWCPRCMLDPSSYDEVARHSPFFAQVWRRERFTR